MSVMNAVSLQSSAAFQVGKKGVKDSFLAFPRNSGKNWEKKNKNIQFRCLVLIKKAIPLYFK